MYSFSYLGSVCCPMSSSNCCFLTCIQVSQEAGQVAWYSHLLQNFPQFVVIHTVKGFGIVNKAEIDFFLELSCFFDDPSDVGNFISGYFAFSKTSLNIWKFTVHLLLKPGLENFKHYFTILLFNQYFIINEIHKCICIFANFWQIKYMHIWIKKCWFLPLQYKYRTFPSVASQTISTLNKQRQPLSDFFSLS